jgi:hypothetical protein
MITPANGPRQHLVGADFDISALKFAPAHTDRFVLSQLFVPVYLGAITTQPASAKPQPDSLKEVIAQISEPLGLMFLDRTRIRPAAMVLGEELLSLSLGPEEVVVLEQKSFSQRETTFEDVNETDTETSLELDSSLTTAMEVALNQQQQHSSTTNAGVSANISGTYYGVKVGVSPSYSTSVTDADNASRSSSLKQTSAASQKITSSYRSVHKTTITVSTQQQFTSSSQRTLRNPNKYTPIDLRFFKIYQEMQLSHERYAIRLVWTPTIKAPGAATLTEANAAYQQVINDAQAAVSLPSPPVPPVMPSPSVQTSPADTEKGDPIGGFRKDLTLIVPAPDADHVWDQDVTFIDNNKTITTVNMNDPAPTYRLNGTPWVDSNGAVNVPIHLGWYGNGPFGGSSSATIQVPARFIPGGSLTPAQETYLQQVADYNAKIATLMAQAKNGALQAAQAAKDAVIEGVDILAECLRQAIGADVPPSLRNSVDWLEVWRALFDWDIAAFTLYPGWWAGQLADPTRPEDDFVNATGARLYLPIRIGLETAGGELVLDAIKAKVDLKALIKEITAYRAKHFGSPSSDPYPRLPAWSLGGLPGESALWRQHHVGLEQVMAGTGPRGRDAGVGGTR